MNNWSIFLITESSLWHSIICKLWNVLSDVVSRLDIPTWIRELSSVWNLKLKANGTFRARLTMWGFEQLPGFHYDPVWISGPLTSTVTVCVVIVILLMIGGYAHIVDVLHFYLVCLTNKREYSLPCHKVGNTSFLRQQSFSYSERSMASSRQQTASIGSWYLSWSPLPTKRVSLTHVSITSGTKNMGFCCG